MAKIVLFINRLIIGGPTNQVIDLYKHLKPQNDVFVVYGLPNKKEVIDPRLQDLINADFIQLNALGGNLNPLKFIKSYFAVKRVFKVINPDIVHTHTAVPGFIGRLAAKRLKVKTLIHTFHGFLFKNYFGVINTYLYKKLERYLYRFTHKIIVLSLAQKNELMSTLKLKNDRKIHIIPLGISTEIDKIKALKVRKEFREVYNISDACVVFASIGRLTKIKNQALFIEALSYLKSKNLSFKAFVVGDGCDYDVLYNAAKKSNLDIFEKNTNTKNYDIVFTSWWHDLSGFLPAMDALVLTSKSEGTPYVLLEAFAFSKAVISTNVGGVKDVVQHNISGLLVNSENLQQLILAMEKLLLDSEKTIQYGKNGRAFVAENFDLKQMLDNTSALYFNKYE